MAKLHTSGTPSPTLSGQYQRQGSTLKGPCTLILVHRAEVTTAKASTYVLKVEDTGKRSYVSSLWSGTQPGTYELEYQGIRYRVTMTETAASVAPVIQLS